MIVRVLAYQRAIKWSDEAGPIVKVRLDDTDGGMVSGWWVAWQDDTLSVRSMIGKGHREVW